MFSNDMWGKDINSILIINQGLASASISFIDNARE
jgi:hypothetical protein